MAVPANTSLVTSSEDVRLANLLGALATGVTDGMHDAMCVAAQMDVVSASALVALLDFSPGGSIRTLGEVVGLTHSGAVRLVDRLVLAGYVLRRQGQDGRARAITLTARGATLARRVRRARERAIAQSLESFSGTERVRLTEYCERLVSALTRQRLEERAAGHAPMGGALCRSCDFAACGRDAQRCPAAKTAAQPLEPEGRSRQRRDDARRR
jgi:MarR family transcriptional regulator, negative regulator of the multidrug operon emrRAB